MRVPHRVQPGKPGSSAEQTDLLSFTHRPGAEVSEVFLFVNVTSLCLPHNKGKRMKLTSKQVPKLFSVVLNICLLQRRCRIFELREGVFPVGGR